MKWLCKILGCDVEPKVITKTEYAPAPKPPPVDYSYLDALLGDRVNIYEGKGEKWRFRIKSCEGKIVSTAGQGHVSKDSIVEDIICVMHALGVKDKELIAQVKARLD